MKPLHRILLTIVRKHNAHSWTDKECVRYFTRSVLRKHRINDKTPVDVDDWLLVLAVAKDQYIRDYRTSVGIDNRYYRPPERTTTYDPSVSTGNT